MLVYLGTGTRRYHAEPVDERPRHNWEFQSVIAGVIEPVIAGQGLGAAGRSLWVFPPHQAHGWSGPDGGRAEVAVFQFNAVPETFTAWFGDRAMHRVELDDAAIARLHAFTDRAAAHIRQPTELSALHFDEILHQLCVLALTGVTEMPLKEELALARHRSDTAVAWYLANLHRQLGLAAVATAVHCSPAHLRRMFHRALGRTPRDVLREAQLHRADEMLAETGWPLRRIAATCGFRNLEVFCRAFTRHRGISPGRWRSQRRPRHGEGKRVKASDLTSE